MSQVGAPFLFCASFAVPEWNRFGQIPGRVGRRWDIALGQSADKVGEPLHGIAGQGGRSWVYSSAMVEVRREAQKHLRCLIAGVDPKTRRALPNPGVLADPEVLRSLAFALDALRAKRGRKVNYVAADARERGEAAWTAEEDQELLVGFRNRVGFRELVAHHGRTEEGILTRLVYLGVVASPQEARVIFRRQQQRLKAPV